LYVYIERKSLEGEATVLLLMQRTWTLGHYIFAPYLPSTFTSTFTSSTRLSYPLLLLSVKSISAN
jgi:hypothetical protein